MIPRKDIGSAFMLDGDPALVVATLAESRRLTAEAIKAPKGGTGRD